MNLFFPYLEIIIIIFIGFACGNRKLFDEKQIEGFQTFYSP
jgi:predicted permease